MKKIIYSLSILLLLFTLSIFYLSVFGFETRKFNSQIEKKVREIKSRNGENKSKTG